MPSRASISPWDKNTPFSVTCKAYLTRCLYFSMALWSLCCKALAPQASFLVLKQDKFILYRQPLHLLFFLLGTLASLVLEICSWGRTFFDQESKLHPTAHPWFIPFPLFCFYSLANSLQNQLINFPLKKKNQLICVYVCFGVHGCTQVCLCVYVQDRG